MQKYSIKEIESEIPKDYQMMVHRYDVSTEDQGTEVEFQLTIELPNETDKIISGLVTYTPKAIADKVTEQFNLLGLTHSPESDLVLSKKEIKC